MTVCPACGRGNPDDSSFCNGCGAPLRSLPAREQRKTVTILFCDITGSTALGEGMDPEALRHLLAQYFERMKAIVESHGGTVEKFIGDAVMAVFGVPVVHEDDALRAVRAAAEMRDALPGLGIEGRIGVNTGAVVTGTAERLATGDAVNVAARLEQAAAPGEVLLGEPTLRLVRDSVVAEQVEPLALKGKTDPVPAHRLVSVGVTPERRASVPMVGRETELRRLNDAFAQAVHDNSCQLFTVLGSPGVGKSRLAVEFLAALGGARVVSGRCLPYGDGITYWPVVEVLEQLGVPPRDPAAAAALASLLGDSDRPTSAQEIAWGFRKLLEEQADERPLVCVFDDIHWGEDAFLELIEHVADLSRDAPVLLLCMARPELLERRPGWGGGTWNATTVLLEALDAAETDRLLDALGGIDDAMRDRIRQAAEGNPLFLEEMLVLLRESGGDEVVVPPTIQALLAARLEQLDPGERSALERGAVEGRSFHQGAVEALSDGEPQLSARLLSLVRKEFVRPARSRLPGDDAYRFRHMLIRDTAYDALPKATRADLHERFAAWLETHGADLVELDEVVGHHLAEAARYRQELGTDIGDVGRRAGKHLAAAGRSALTLGDYGAATTLLSHAAELVGDSAARAGLLCDLADGLIQGGHLAEAVSAMDEAAALAAATGDRHNRDRAAVLQLVFRSFGMEKDHAGSMGDAIDPLARIAAAALDRGDDEVAAVALGYAAQLTFYCGGAGKAAELGVQALDVAVRAGDQGAQDQIRTWLGIAMVHGPTHVDDALRFLDELSRSPRMRSRSMAKVFHAELVAMTGDFEAARAQSDEGLAELDDVGMVVIRAGASQSRARIEAFAGDHAAAERILREGWVTLAELGERGFRSSVGAMLAQALVRQDRVEEAEAILDDVDAIAASDDVEAQMRRRLVRGAILAGRGEIDDGLALVREASGLAAATDYSDVRNDALLGLAAVLVLAGRADEARNALADARTICERKGNVVGVGVAERRLAELA